MSGRRRHAPARTPFAPPAPSYSASNRPIRKSAARRGHPPSPSRWSTASSPQTDGPGAAISRSRATTHEPALASNPPLDRPAFVPRTTGRRREMTRTAGASNPQVRNQIRPSPQVAKPVPRTLSRWRHGFEPRWDYERESAGQRHCSAGQSREGDSAGGARSRNIPHEIDFSGPRSPSRLPFVGRPLCGPARAWSMARRRSPPWDSGGG